MMRIFGLFCICFLLVGFLVTANAQKTVSITIDDVPWNRSNLFEVVDSMDLPVTVFINEGKLYQNGGMLVGPVKLLNKWSSKSNITLANHTFSHSRYSKVGYEAFTQDVLNGEKLTNTLLPEGKKLEHFRFPYNDLGKDSLQQDSIKRFLDDQGYKIAPFTVESSDWKYNKIYRHYLKENKKDSALWIAQSYVDYTMQLFHFFDSVLVAEHGRDVSHIYLCHDNPLNEYCLPIIVEKLRQKDYKVVSYDESLKDSIYHQTNYYHKKYGVSWVYRWTNDKSKFKRWMNTEPLLPSVIDWIYKKI